MATTTTYFCDACQKEIGRPGVHTIKRSFGAIDVTLDVFRHRLGVFDTADRSSPDICESCIVAAWDKGSRI